MRFGVACGGLLASSLQQVIGVAGQTSSGMDHFHPRRIAVAVTALRLLIGKAGESGPDDANPYWRGRHHTDAPSAGPRR
jgi:hypothetical protein